MAESKVAKIKKEMMWQKTGPMCSNCENYKSDLERTSSTYGNYYKERNRRCGSGGFATTKQCWCAEHEFKTE